MKALWLKQSGSLENQRADKYSCSSRLRDNIHIVPASVAEEHKISISRRSQAGIAKPQYGVYKNVSPRILKELKPLNYSKLFFCSSLFFLKHIRKSVDMY